MAATKKNPFEKKYENLKAAVNKMRTSQKSRDNAVDVSMKKSHTALAKKAENKVDKLLTA